MGDMIWRCHRVLYPYSGNRDVADGLVGTVENGYGVRIAMQFVSRWNGVNRVIRGGCGGQELGKSRGAKRGIPSIITDLRM